MSDLNSSKIVKSSGNVFEDIGFKDAKDRLDRSNKAIEKSKLEATAEDRTDQIHDLTTVDYLMLVVSGIFVVAGVALIYYTIVAFGAL